MMSVTKPLFQIILSFLRCLSMCLSCTVVCNATLMFHGVNELYHLKQRQAEKSQPTEYRSKRVMHCVCSRTVGSCFSTSLCFVWLSHLPDSLEFRVTYTVMHLLSQPREKELHHRKLRQSNKNEPTVLL